jgi:poly(3-hydroxybutyrate) depolymerase
MINYFNELYCIDTARYYAAGKSDGGGFTGVLACDSSLSTQIAAFAPVSGAFYIPGSTESDCAPQSISLPCSPGRAPLPVIEFHGSNDTTIPYSGGPRKTACLPAVPHWVEEWSIRQEYGLTNKTTSLFGNMVQKYEYGGGNGSLGIVTHYLTDELGHDWPSTVPNDDNPFGTYYNATPIIMDFFNKYTL